MIFVTVTTTLPVQAGYKSPVVVRNYRGRVWMAGKYPRLSATVRLGPRQKIVPDVSATLWVDGGIRSRTVGRLHFQVKFPL